ncbi:MAG: hypothetical protein KIH63_002175 [Candidatus Saccharibacteria bacterium]|nr:hypothetical protein [Candidatus Saccharibacteria bacterium]
MKRQTSGGVQNSGDTFSYHQQAAAEIAEMLARQAEEEEAAAAAQAAGAQGTVYYRWPLSARIAVGALTVVGATVVVGAAGFGIASFRNEPEVQDRAGRACDLSSGVVGAIVQDACTTQVDTAIPLLAKTQPTDPNQSPNYVYGGVKYVAQSDEAFVTPIRPGQSAGLVVVWDAVANEQYAQTQQSASRPADEISASGLTRGIEDAYKAATVPADQDALYELCMLDNQTRVAALRANAQQFAGSYQVIDLDGNAVLDSQDKPRTVSFEANRIADSTSVLDPLDFAPYTYTSFDAQRIEGAVDGALKPAFPEIASRQLIQVDEYGNRLTCPVPTVTGEAG